MPGVRIHHREKRDCVVQIPHMGRPTAHGPKLYNVALDSNGEAIVSPTVWARLQEALGLLGNPSVFLVLDEVKEPPALVVGDVHGRARQVLTLIDGQFVEARRG